MWGVVVIIVLAIGAFWYVSRPLPAPSTNTTATATTTGPMAELGETAYALVAEKSEAKYEIDETLNGSPKHVVGTTTNVSGDLFVNMSEPAKSRLGTITINARTLKTDSDKRDNTVGRVILKSADEANEFITFEPAKLLGMPSKLEEGKEFMFKVTGNLTAAGVTKEVTFDGKATPSGKTIVGTVSTVVKYSDFDMSIPKLPFLAWVDDKVTLTLNFVANAK